MMVRRASELDVGSRFEFEGAGYEVDTEPHFFVDAEQGNFFMFRAIELVTGKMVVLALRSSTLVATAPVSL